MSRHHAIPPMFFNLQVRDEYWKRGKRGSSHGGREIFSPLSHLAPQRCLALWPSTVGSYLANSHTEDGGRAVGRLGVDARLILCHVCAGLSKLGIGGHSSVCPGASSAGGTLGLGPVSRGVKFPTYKRSLSSMREDSADVNSDENSPSPPTRGKQSDHVSRSWYQQPFCAGTGCIVLSDI